MQLSRTTIAVLLGAFLLHSCQQPQLGMAGDKLKQQAPSTLQALSPRARQGTEAITKQELSGVVLTSSSDSSPDIKHTNTAALDCGTTAQSMMNVPRDSALALANTDRTIIEASSKEVVKKRPATAQLNKIEEQQAITKQAKIEASSPSHQKWFASFTQTAAQIEEDQENETAWDDMEKILDEGAKLNFLTASITCTNDSNLVITTYEYTPVHYAAVRGLLELVKELIEKRSVDANLQTSEKKNTPLHMAAAGGQLDVVAYLIKEKNVEISKIDCQGASALHYAAAGKYGENNKDVTEYIVGIKEEEIMKCTNDNLSVLELAVHAGNVSVVKYCVAKFANRNNDAVKKHMKKALKMAEAMSEREIIAHILENSCNHTSAR